MENLEIPPKNQIFPKSKNLKNVKQFEKKTESKINFSLEKIFVIEISGTFYFWKVTFMIFWYLRYEIRIWLHTFVFSSIVNVRVSSLHERIYVYAHMRTSGQPRIHIKTKKTNSYSQEWIWDFEIVHTLFFSIGANLCACGHPTNQESILK